MTALHVAAFISAAVGIASAAYGEWARRKGAEDRRWAEHASKAAEWRTEDMKRQWRERGEARREARRIEG